MRESVKSASVRSKETQRLIAEAAKRRGMPPAKWLEQASRQRTPSGKPMDLEVVAYNEKNEDEVLSVVISFNEAQSWRVPNALATDGNGNWFLCQANGTNCDVPRESAEQVSLVEACEWFSKCYVFSDCYDSWGMEDLMEAVAKELRRLEGRKA